VANLNRQTDRPNLHIPPLPATTASAGRKKGGEGGFSDTKDALTYPCVFEDMDQAIVAAQQAFLDFRDISIDRRKKIISAIRNICRENIKNLAQDIWENCAQPLGFKLKEPIKADVIRDDEKVSKIWGETKGRATKIDRILVLKKS